MRTASLTMGSCVLAALMAASTQAAATPAPAVEFTFTRGDFTNTGSLGGAGNIAIRDTAWGGDGAPSETLSAAGVNPYPGNTTLQSLVVPGTAGGGRVKSLNIADGGLFNVGHSGATSAMTLSFWVNPTALGGYLAGRATDGAQGWMLGLEGHAGGLRFADSGCGNFDTQDMTGSNQVAINTWQFITLTWNATTGVADVYRNGVDLGLETYGDGAHAAADVSPTLTFGASGTWGAFDGNLSAIRLWDSAFTPTQVADLYASEPAPVPEPASMALLGVGSLIVLRRRRA